MADNDRGQNLLNKYVWVIEAIYKAKKISFKELNERWLNDDISRGVDIPKRTFDNWRYAVTMLCRCIYTHLLFHFVLCKNKNMITPKQSRIYNEQIPSL